MSGCLLCPRECGANRAQQVGFCGAAALPNVARAALHMWEEPFISGSRGSGAIFFCGCNLDCLFCQNSAINHSIVGEAVNHERLAEIMLTLQRAGAHNINLVTPTPHIDIIIPALIAAKDKGLTLPIVYNTNAYEKVEQLRRLEGLVDIYLPDIKYVSKTAAKRYSKAEDYFEFAARAVLEMQRQCGKLSLDENGLARRGLVVRHLVLPGSLDETRGVLDFIKAELGCDTQVSLMGQYVPCGSADFPPLNRRLLPREYWRAVEHCIQLGLANVLIQELSAADASYTPDFCGGIISECE